VAQVAHHESRFAIVHVRDGCVLGKTLDHAIVETQTPALDGQAGQQ